MSAGEPGLQTRGSRSGPGVWLLALAAPLVVMAVVIGLVTGGSGDADAPEGVGLAAAPLDLATASADVAAHYRFAADHQQAYEKIPCYCGCEAFLAHRSLFDCFVRSDGAGWDAHAAGCGICIGESVLARDLLEDGVDPAAVRDAVIDRFGSTTATTPPRA